VFSASAWSRSAGTGVATASENRRRKPAGRMSSANPRYARIAHAPRPSPRPEKDSEGSASDCGNFSRIVVASSPMSVEVITVCRSRTVRRATSSGAGRSRRRGTSRTHGTRVPARDSSKRISDTPPFRASRTDGLPSPEDEDQRGLGASERRSATYASVPVPSRISVRR